MTGIEHSGSRLQRALPAALIVLLTIIAYWPAISGGGFIWDDDSYVTENRLLWEEGGLRRIWLPDDSIQPRSEDADSLRFAKFWFKPRTPQYYPVVFTTFWIEWRLWGDEPRGYHTVNVLLHAANALLIWLILLRLKIPGGAVAAWMVAAIFALHPIHVESVAWITERKNTLSLFFYLLAAMAYLRFDDDRTIGNSRAVVTRGAVYALALLLFIFALLSKSVTCSLPAALILIMFWQRKPLTLRRLALLVPFFIIGFVLAMNTALIERELVGARGPDFDFTFIERTLIASRALLFYVEKHFWPHPLMFIYPRWEIDTGSAVQYLPLAFWVIVAVALLAMLLRGVRGPFVALSFFAGTAFPALGYFNVYPHIFSFVADHFIYHASVGMIVLIVGGSAHLFATFRERKQQPPLETRGLNSQPLNSPIGYLSLPMIVILLALTWRQAAIYESAERVYRHTLARNHEAWMPHNNLASILLRRADEARRRGEDHMMRALAEEALTHTDHAIALRPVNHPSYANRTEALRLLGQYEDALTSIRCARELAPHLMDYAWQEGRLLHLLGRYEEAVVSHREAVEHASRSVTYHHDLAVSLQALHRLAEAAEHYEAILDVIPDHHETIQRLGAIYFTLERHVDAERLLRQAIETAPNQDLQVQALVRLIRLLATSPDQSVRNLDEALDMALRLASFTEHNDPGVLSMLASVYAERGEMDRAIATGERAVALARDYGMYDIEQLITEQLRQYHRLHR